MTIVFDYLAANVGDFLISPEGEVYLILKKLSRQRREFRCLTLEGKIKNIQYVFGPIEIFGPNNQYPKTTKFWQIKSGKKK